MIDEIEDDVVCGRSTYGPMTTLGDYLQEYNRINKQIVALEIQINILRKSAERYDVSYFDSTLHQIEHELFLQKREIGPIIMIFTRTLSTLIPGGSGDGEIAYEHFFLGRSSQEIARQHGLTDQYVAKNMVRFLKAPVPSKLVDECRKIFS